MKLRIIDIITFTQSFAGHGGQDDIKLHIDDLKITGKFNKNNGNTRYFIEPNKCILTVAEDGFPLDWSKEALREIDIDHEINNMISTYRCGKMINED